jgi:hypothetical protein
MKVFKYKYVEIIYPGNNFMLNVPITIIFQAIDVWMAACLTFVFLGLLEFAYVNVQSRVLNRRKSVIQFMMHQNGGKSTSIPSSDATNGSIYNEVTFFSNEVLNFFIQN